MSTKRLCEPEKWNGKANRAIGNKEDIKALNAYLDMLQNQVYDARTHLIDRGEDRYRALRCEILFPAKTSDNGR